MSAEVSERSFEDAIECSLLQHGPDACVGDTKAVHETLAAYGATLPGGYLKRGPGDYDRALCLLPRDVVDFVLATQPKEWQKLAQHHGAAVREQFLKRLAGEVERRGVLDVLRQGIKDSGCKFQLAYFRPASGLNEETRRLHAANLFTVVRQLRYSAKNEKSLDLVLFLNGLPIFTAELKNLLNGQDVEDAIRQYKTDRDPRETLLAHGRCLAHFAVDLAQAVRNGLGDRAGTCIDPKIQIVQGKTVGVVSCQRSPEPVFLRWNGIETSAGGDFFVRSGPGTVKLPADSATQYIRTRFASAVRPAESPSEGAV